MTEIGDLKLFSIKEASALLGFQYESLRRYVKEGKIKARKLGVRYLISEDSLKDYFNCVA